jgi:ABC transporter with metal-binding/Fe-S-binding domain ATP-binding protein
MKVAALVSGGKDSIYALYKAIKEGHEVKVLVSFVAKNEESYMFHIPNIKYAELIGKAIGIEIHQFMISGEKEFEVNEMKAALHWLKREYELEGVVSGAIASKYQKERIDAVCKELELQSIAPLWGIEPEKYLHELLKEGFKIIFSSVSAEGFDESWLGRELDEKAIEDLKTLNRKHGVHLAFEGGEAETFVLDGPIFKRRIEINDAKKEWHGNCGVYKINKASLIKK